MLLGQLGEAVPSLAPKARRLGKSETAPKEVQLRDGGLDVEHDFGSNGSYVHCVAGKCFLAGSTFDNPSITFRRPSGLLRASSL